MTMTNTGTTTTSTTNTDCLFCRIVAGTIPSTKLYEDEQVICFLDIRPNNPGHTLIVPKQHSRNIFDMAEEDVRAVFAVAKKLAGAVQRGVEADGINITMNNEPAAGQIIYHSHVHVIPRFENDGFKHWPGKPYEEGQAGEVQKRILSALGKNNRKNKE